MRFKSTSLCIGLLCFWLGSLATNSAAQSGRLTLEANDHICLIGNALGERMQHQNYWETLLYQLYPDKNLTVRNLCFPGDAIDTRLRSLNFGSPDKHLKHSNATVILFFFGSVESFSGKRGADEFGEKLDALVAKTKSMQYGDRPPKIALISPTAFERTGDPNLPDGDQRNKDLKTYANKMASVARKHGVVFADILTPTVKLFGSSDKRLTLDGIQLNSAGYEVLAPVLCQALFETAEIEEPKLNSELRSAIADKNFHWWHRYRAVNGYSIYGGRRGAGSDGTYNNRDVMERELAILDQMTANRDQRIWSIAQGKTISEPIDDSNTLPFINPKTNVTSGNDNEKLGTLDYMPAAQQMKKFQLAEGYEINLFASEEQFPELANPVALNFDNQGRMWVSVMPSYPHWKPKTKLDDKLLIFTDSDSDGQADQCKVFADGLYLPTGFELGHGGAYVAQQPDILFLKDTDGDDVADVRIRQLVGLGTADSHHGIAAFEWGPGGGLYFGEGTFKYSQVESPWGTTRLNEAGIWRFEPRTHRTSVHANFSFSNPWGMAFDDWGQDFVADASGGNNFWLTPITGATTFPAKHLGGGHDRRIFKSKLEKQIPSPPELLPQRTRPSCGCEIVSSRNFPPEVQGNYLLNNVIGDRAVLNHKLADKDSGFLATEVDPIVSCDDGNFRPVDLQFGPDGALYIVDWHNALIGHLQHNLRDPSRDHSHGRIWRVTYKSRPLIEPPKIKDATIAELLDHLKLPEYRNRYRARRELAARDTEPVTKELKTWLENLDPADALLQRHLLEAIWVYQTHNVVNQELLKRLLNSDDARARAAATRVLSFWHDRVDGAIELLKSKINDKSARTRIEAVRAASFFPAEDVTEIVLDVLNHPTDPNIDYALEETLRTLESK